MYPVLFRIGSFTAYSYGFIVFWAFTICLSAGLYEAKKKHLPIAPILVQAYLGGAIGLLGARLLGVALHLIRHPGHHRLSLLFWNSGSTYLGGMIAAILFCAAYAWSNKISFWKQLDFFAPYIALGEGIGRIGCLLAGCCYGIRYEGPFAIMFESYRHSDAPINTLLFPVQPLGFVAGILNFSILMYLRNKTRFDGQLALIFILLYSVTRGLLEFLRGDLVRGMWFDGLASTSQLICLALFFSAGIVLLRKRAAQSRISTAKGVSN